MPDINIATTLSKGIDPARTDKQKGISRSELGNIKTASTDPEEIKILGVLSNASLFAKLDTNEDGFLSNDELVALGKRDGTQESISFKDAYSFAAESKFGPEIEKAVNDKKGDGKSGINFPTVVVNKGEHTLKFGIGRDQNLYLYVIPNKAGESIKKFTIPFNSQEKSAFDELQEFGLKNKQTLVRIPGTLSEHLSPRDIKPKTEINLAEKDPEKLKVEMNAFSKHIMSLLKVDGTGELIIPDGLTSEVQRQEGSTIKDLEASKPKIHTNEALDILNP